VLVQQQLVGVARDDILNGGAFNAGQDDSFELRRLYAISDVLTVPEGGGGPAMWGEYTIDSSSGSDVVYTGDWLGILDVTARDSGWIYSYTLTGWTYFPMAPEADSAGSWMYIVR
jgi:hypothetical protein